MGQTQEAVATMFDRTRQSVGSWVRRYRERGLEGLAIAPGRGRKPKVDGAELISYAEKSPRAFGINRSRWTLRLLAQTVPSLHGFSDGGVLRALKRYGFAYKRGQPWLCSPDPEYAKKGQVIMAAIEHADRCPGSVVVLFQDEASFYRQPSQGWLWAWAGRRQPKLPWSHRKNTLVRLAGCLNAHTGETHYHQAPKISVPELLRSYRKILKEYPHALMTYLIQDNWPVHDHPDVQQFLADNPRLVVLRLPTYAPRLNPIEKVWRWIRQTLCHAHPFCDDFREFKAHLQAACHEAQTIPETIQRYCGIAHGYIFRQ
jgi:transposase